MDFSFAKLKELLLCLVCILPSGPHTASLWGPTFIMRGITSLPCILKPVIFSWPQAKDSRCRLWALTQPVAEGVKGLELCTGPTCARASEGMEGCTESLFGGWLRGQRPHSQDGPLPSREGHAAGYQSSVLNIYTTKQCKPTLLCIYLMQI